MLVPLYFAIFNVDALTILLHDRNVSEFRLKCLDEDFSVHGEIFDYKKYLEYCRPNIN